MDQREAAAVFRAAALVCVLILIAMALTPFIPRLSPFNETMLALSFVGAMLFLARRLMGAPRSLSL